VQLQERSAAALARFINYASSSDSGLRANPSDKLVKNLCTFVCQDTTQTPIFIHFKDTSKGILSLPDRPVPGEKIGSVKGITVPTESDESLRNKRIRRGAESALNKLCLQVGGRIFDQLPRLWSCMSETLLSMYSTGWSACFKRRKQILIDDPSSANPDERSEWSGSLGQPYSFGHSRAPTGSLLTTYDRYLV